LLRRGPRRGGGGGLGLGAVQGLLAVALGTAVGLALNWSVAGALFFGAVLAISSGAVLSKILGERGELDAEHGRIALAWSTVQDLATIVLVVLLPALGPTAGAHLEDVALALGKALLFLVLLVPA